MCEEARRYGVGIQRILLFGSRVQRWGFFADRGSASIILALCGAKPLVKHSIRYVSLLLHFFLLRAVLYSLQSEDHVAPSERHARRLASNPFTKGNHSWASHFKDSRLGPCPTTAAHPAELLIAAANLAVLLQTMVHPST